MVGIYRHRRVPFFAAGDEYHAYLEELFGPAGCGSVAIVFRIERAQNSAGGAGHGSLYDAGAQNPHISKDDSKSTLDLSSRRAPTKILVRRSSRYFPPACHQ